LIHLLEEKKLVVQAVESAKDALAALEQHPPDLIISDIGMPVTDGHGLLKQIRQWEARTHTAEIPVIALTSYVKLDDRQTTLEAGFKSYLTKPIEPDQLFGVLTDLLK
jgi:CheY-like chemotaxis protein